MRAVPIIYSGGISSINLNGLIVIVMFHETHNFFLYRQYSKEQGRLHTMVPYRTTDRVWKSTTIRVSLRRDVPMRCDSDDIQPLAARSCSIERRKAFPPRTQRGTISAPNVIVGAVFHLWWYWINTFNRQVGCIHHPQTIYETPMISHQLKSVSLKGKDSLTI